MNEVLKLYSNIPNKLKDWEELQAWIEGLKTVE